MQTDFYPCEVESLKGDIMAMDLGNTKVQLVAAQEGFRDEELFVPEDVFSEAGAFVDIASNSTRTAHGMLGGEVDPDIAIDRIDVDSLDALVIAGGKGSPQYLWSNPDLLEKVREAYAKGKIVGAICMSGVVLAQAGILKGQACDRLPRPGSAARAQAPRGRVRRHGRRGRRQHSDRQRPGLCEAVRRGDPGAAADPACDSTTLATLKAPRFRRRRQDATFSTRRFQGAKSFLLI